MRTFRRFLSHRLAVLGLALLLIMALCAIFAPLVAPARPSAIDLTRIARPPGGQNLLGTDAVGRDVLSRLIYGARVSLSVGVVAVTIYMTIVFLAVMVYVSSDADSWRSFVRPLWTTLVAGSFVVQVILAALPVTLVACTFVITGITQSATAAAVRGRLTPPPPSLTSM